MQTHPITEHVMRRGSHVQFWLECGPESGPLIVFVHGWPELGWSWRHQLPIFGALGFRAVAPDLRGYGRSTLYRRHADYAQPYIVADMVALLDHLGREQAVWVGHDWGSPTVWSIARHHPERCFAVASLCVPYATIEHGLDALIQLVDRDVYPAERFPAGQWDYQCYYEESFDASVASMEGNVANTVKALFRRGDPQGAGQPVFTASVRATGGWFGGGPAPDVPRDEAVLSEHDLSVYVAALTNGGFFGPNSYYMNHAANAHYTASARGDARLEMPVLFLHAAYDTVCETIRSRLAEPMRALCGELREVVVESGHWMAQERPREVNGAIVGWLASRVPRAWPSPS